MTIDTKTAFHRPTPAGRWIIIAVLAFGALFGMHPNRAHAEAAAPVNIEDVYALPKMKPPKRPLLSNKPAPKLPSQVLRYRLKRFSATDYEKMLPKNVELLCRAGDLWDMPRYDKKVEAAYRHLIAKSASPDLSFLARVYLAEFLLRNARLQEGRELLKNQEEAIAVHPIFSRSYMESSLPSVAGHLDAYITYREGIEGKIDYYRTINDKNIRFMLMDTNGIAVRSAKAVITDKSYRFSNIKPGKYRLEVFWRIANTFHRSDYDIVIRPDEQTQQDLSLRFLRLQSPADGALIDPRASITFSWQIAVLKGVYGAQVTVTDVKTGNAFTFGADEWIRKRETTVEAGHSFLKPGREYRWSVQAARLGGSSNGKESDLSKDALHSAEWSFRIGK